MHKLGEKISWVKKIGMGFSLMLFILALIAGPMLLFSSINPVGQPNPVSKAQLQFYITIDNTYQGTKMNVPLFETIQLTKNMTLTESQYDSLQFGYVGSESDEFPYSQVQAL